MLRSSLILIAFLISATGVGGNLDAAEKRVPASKLEIELSFAPLVKSAAPAVVNIYTQKVVRTRGRGLLFDDPFFRRFFGEDFGKSFGGFGGPARRLQNSLGSGVIVDPSGIIVTNKHVIDEGEQIRVVLADRREFEAEVMVKDDRTDLAILKVQIAGETLPYLKLRDSDELEVGDLVLAIGNPFGVGQTVTSGIVSALARTQIGGSDLASFIQTDAAINPGNSGGALIAMDGRLVGVNTAIFSKSGGSHGIGFAIPSNMVRAVVKGVSRDGRLIRPWLGAAGQSVTPDIAASLGMERPTGVLMKTVHPDGSAAQGGVRSGDVILAVNGHEVFDPNSLRHRIATLTIGETAAFRVLRGGETSALHVSLSAAPEVPLRDITVLKGPQPLAGATVANLSPALAEELRVDPFRTGVAVMEIEPGSAANRLRFRTGDVIKVVNGDAISEVARLVSVLERETARWRITVDRDGKSLDLVINR